MNSLLMSCRRPYVLYTFIAHKNSIKTCLDCSLHLLFLQHQAQQNLYCISQSHILFCREDIMSNLGTENLKMNMCIISVYPGYKLDFAKTNYPTLFVVLDKMVWPKSYNYPEHFIMICLIC